jgi:hypothetical protein
LGTILLHAHNRRKASHDVPAPCLIMPRAGKRSSTSLSG